MLAMVDVHTTSRVVDQKSPLSATYFGNGRVKNPFLALYLRNFFLKKYLN